MGTWHIACLEFTVCAEKFIDDSDVLDKTIPLYSAATQQLVEARGRGQDFQRCNCRATCAKDACLCRRKGVLCNSKYQSTSTCTNK